MGILSLKHGWPNEYFNDPCDKYPPANNNTIIQQWQVTMNKSRYFISNATIMLDESVVLNNAYTASNEFYFNLKSELGCINGEYDQPVGMNIVPAATRVVLTSSELTPTDIPKPSFESQIGNSSDKLWIIISVSAVSLLGTIIIISLLIFYRKRPKESFESNPRILRVSSTKIPQDAFKDIVKKINGRDYERLNFSEMDQDYYHHSNDITSGTVFDVPNEDSVHQYDLLDTGASSFNNMENKLNNRQTRIFEAKDSYGDKLNNGINDSDTSSKDNRGQKIYSDELNNSIRKLMKINDDIKEALYKNRLGNFYL
jgi:hypothetical protein